MTTLPSVLLPSVPVVLRTLDRLAKEIERTPTFEGLNRIRRTAKAVQMEFREVKDVSDGLREEKRQGYTARSNHGGAAKSLSKLVASGRRFSVIYADPPWKFEAYSGNSKQRSADRHYDSMTLDAIAALPIGKLAGDDCALLLWAVMPELPGALRIVKSWGFTYKTVGFVWIEQNRSGEGLFTGMGWWTRANAELCLLATKGSPTRLAMDVHQIIMAPVDDHSVKPEETRHRIQRLFPGPYLELFARTKHRGWTTWGNEIVREKTEYKLTT